MAVEDRMKPAVVVHGGAGQWSTSVARRERAVRDCKAAAMAGQAILLAGGEAVDAVETAVLHLENSPVLDAGRGSYLNAAGYIEMDAIIMDGRTLDLGAIAAVQRVLNPISLARRVMTDNLHNFLVAGGAEEFADAIGFPRCEIADLLTDGQLEEYMVWKSSNNTDLLPDQTLIQSGNTVGAVAIDSRGNLAAATSTGGTHLKQPGRVGDSPLVGSGAYADNQSAAASATGHGESLMKILISKQVCDHVARGYPAQLACHSAIELLSKRVNGLGGIISIDKEGRVGAAYNTRYMPHAFAVGETTLTALP